MGTNGPSNINFGLTPSGALGGADPRRQMQLREVPVIQIDVRDALGNARGGVRTPFVDAPLATYVPTDTVAHPTALSGFCILDGYNIPFDATQRAALYANHGDYVQRVVTQSAELVRDGFWLLPDALQVIEAASRARVP